MKLKKDLAAGGGCKLALLALAFAFLGAEAKTTTWIRPCNYSSASKVPYEFTDASNWDNGAPAPGDTLVITNRDTGWDKQVYVTAASDFDLGTSDLTFQIDNSAYTRIAINFTGSGRIVKTGNGRYGVAGNASHTGGTEVRNGNIEPWGNYTFGTGAITLTRAYGNTPKLQTDTWNVGLKTPLVFEGSGNGYTMLETGQLWTFWNTVTSEFDFTVYAKYGTMAFHGDVSAPGHTITVKGSRTQDNNNPPNIVFHKAVNASLVKQGERSLTLNGTSTDIDASLTVEDGPCIFGAAARWAGTNIVMYAPSKTMTLNSSDNLSTNAVLHLSAGAKLSISNAVVQAVKSLFVDGVEVDAGLYSAATLPAAITNTSFSTGMLVVRSGNGKSAGFKTWIGMVENARFSDPANWSDNSAPQPGDVLLFPSSAPGKIVLEAETFDIGAAGITVISYYKAWEGICCYVSFTGSGSFTKLGNGAFTVRADSSHTGGTVFYDGILQLMNRSATSKLFGTGPIELRAENGKRPYIITAEWDCGLLNDIHFYGENTASVGGVYCNNPGRIGNVTADSDLKLGSRYSNLTFTGAVSVAGHTLTVNTIETTTTGYPGNLYFLGPVDANVVKIGDKTSEFRGISPNPDNSFTLTCGTNTFTAAARWGGTNIVVNGESWMALKGSDNLSPDAVVSIDTTDGAKIFVDSGVKVCVARLYVNGTRKGDSVYTKDNLPGVIAGNGKLKVGHPGLTIVFR